MNEELADHPAALEISAGSQPQKETELDADGSTCPPQEVYQNCGLMQGGPNDATGPKRPPQQRPLRLSLIHISEPTRPY